MKVFQAGRGKAYTCGYLALPFLFCCFLGAAFPAWAESADGITDSEITATGDSPSLPTITRLDARDMAFKQYLADVEASRRLLFSSRQNLDLEKIASSLTIYSYVPRADDGLMAIAARCNIPYGTIASLNRFSGLDDFEPGKPLLLPSVPGIFVPESPDTDLERLIIAAREETTLILSIPREGKPERFRFKPGDDFSPTERIYFLDQGFRFPLKTFRLTSEFGPRINPVTGRPGTHQGVDLAAPIGTEVFAVRNGTVVDLGEDPIFGKYIIIRHMNNMVSLYGHLSSINVSFNEIVQSGGFIGRVGTTGQSTGPHLHFELRQNGQSQDPARLLGLFRR